MRRPRVKSLENEIQDLQSEFELDRIDYLDTIRRQDQQLKLMQQLLDKIQPCLRRDSNYANLEKVKKEAVWDEDLQKWHLPDVSLTKTQLPNGGIMPGGRLPAQPALSPRQVNGFTDDGEDNKLKSRLAQSSAENIANSYFKPLRASNIMTKTEADKNRSLDNHHSTNFPNNRTTWDNLMNGVIYTNDIYERPISPAVSPSNGSVKKPQRLESLGSNFGNGSVSSAKKSRRKK